jgi:hypothetical protein
MIEAEGSLFAHNKQGASGAHEDRRRQDAKHLQGRDRVEWGGIA